jgi:beta-lactamase superfamily II metal-dependent hydrolase
MNKHNRTNSLPVRVLAIIAILTLLSSLQVDHAASTPLPTGTHIPGAFEIHIFDVDQGDSQLIIFPSGFTLLIDLGEPTYNTDKNAVRIASEIRALTGGSHVNVGLITHLHMDHVGYFEGGGFWALIEEQGITFDKIIDRDAGIWQDGFDGTTLDGECNYETEIVWHNAGEVSNTMRKWLCYATDPANALIYDWRELAQRGSTAQIDPPDSNVTVTIIQVDAFGLMKSDGITPVAGDHTLDGTPPSENDYSIALKITYGAIDYVTAGDTDGEYDGSYNNGETLIAPLIGPVELMHVNHHGSSHSTNQFYVDTLEPADAFISCGSTYDHPAQEVLDRLTATADVYQTNECEIEEPRDYTGVHTATGDITIRSLDALTYAVTYTHYVQLPIILKP